MKRIILSFLVASVFMCAGCEDDDNDHVPPAGKGSLVIDNHTDDLEVYIDGVYLSDVDDYDDATFDLAPGSYRLTLVADHDDRYHSDYIDILIGRLTIVDVNVGHDFDEYDLDIEYD